jgi:hypothetical protein
MRSLLLVAAAATPFLPLALPAQEPPAIAVVRTAEGFRQAAEKNFNAYESNLTTHCPTATVDWLHATHKVYGQPTAGADGGLVNATWVETAPGSACGQNRRYRVLVTIRAGKANVASLLPGESFASPTLEVDAVQPLAKATAEFVPKGQKCAVDVLDTRLEGPAPTASKQPWNEVWTVATCNRRLNVPIRFVPDAVGDGTSIRIESKSVLIAP